MLKRILVILIFYFLLFPQLSTCYAQSSKPPSSEFQKAKVISITEKTEQKDLIQTIKAELLDGKDKNKVINTKFFLPSANSEHKLLLNDELILEKTTIQNKTEYRIIDKFRLNNLITLIVGFFILVLFATGKKGIGAILGLIVSFVVILYFIVPQILNGADPLFISIIGSIIIMTISIYLAHGITQRTTIALASTALSLLLTGILAVVFVGLTKLSGLGSEDVYTIQMTNSALKVQGLLLGGIIIGSLGVLDDITTAQTAVIYELAKANEKLQVKELFIRGYSVGKEHILSLVNTLVLAYAGASLAIFMLFVINPLNRPYWVILNNEMIVEEVVRTLAGSTGLILAVPITTLLAAFFSRYNLNIK